MGLFKKRKDPISERAKALNHQIAALQAEIERLADNPEEPDSAAAAPREATPSARSLPKQASSSKKAGPHPRLRSTAIPQREAARRASSKAPTPARSEPVFEEVGQPGASEPATPPSAAHYNDLGVRKYDLASLWKRWTTHFRGPATNNPKLVNYLAAGSIQGLRPLRYEKRVARNRFVFFVVILIAVLWGLIAIWIKRS